MSLSDNGSESKRIRLKAEDRKTQIIAAAREVFVEQGISGATSRLIAQRAGITEAYLYRHFHSKDEIFRLAIEAPLDELVLRLRNETHELATRDDVSRSEVLLRSHELLLACMVDIAPLVMAALFSDSENGSTFYSSYLMPSLRAALEPSIPDMTGFPVGAFDVELFVEAMIGIHLTIALESVLDDRPVDVPQVAREVTDMFAAGVSPRLRSSGQSASSKAPRSQAKSAKTKSAAAPLPVKVSARTKHPNGAVGKRK